MLGQWCLLAIRGCEGSFLVAPRTDPSWLAELAHAAPTTSAAAKPDAGGTYSPRLALNYGYSATGNNGNEVWSRQRPAVAGAQRTVWAYDAAGQVAAGSLFVPQRGERVDS